MTKILISLGLGLLIGILASALVLGDRRSSKENRKRLLVEYAKFEAEWQRSLTSIFKMLGQDDTCEKGDPGCRDSSPDDVLLPEEYQMALESIMTRVENIHHIMITLIPIATQVTTWKTPAVVSHPNVLNPKLNTSINFSCGSNGKSLSFCIWQQTNPEGGHKVIYIDDDDVIQNGGKTSVEGIMHEADDGLSGGKCGLKIESVAVDHIGSWFCTLVSQLGKVFTGEVTIGFANQGNSYGKLRDDTDYTFPHDSLEELGSGGSAGSGSDFHESWSSETDSPPTQDDDLYFPTGTDLHRHTNIKTTEKPPLHTEDSSSGALTTEKTVLADGDFGSATDPDGED